MNEFQCPNCGRVHASGTDPTQAQNAFESYMTTGFCCDPCREDAEEFKAKAQERLEYLRGELRAERISWGELAELQRLADQIEPGDVELLEAAGVPESFDNE